MYSRKTSFLGYPTKKIDNVRTKKIKKTIRERQ